MEHQKSLTNYLKNYLPKQPNLTISPTLFCLITGRKEFLLCFKLAMFLSFNLIMCYIYMYDDDDDDLIILK